MCSRHVQRLLQIGLALVGFLPCTIGVVYYWEPGNRSWNQSRDHCLSLGRQLVSIHTEDEYTAVTQFLDGLGVVEKVWIGLRLPMDKETEADFGWVDGAELYWTNWDDGDPNFMDTKKCVLLRMDKNKKYDSKGCTDYIVSCVCEDTASDDPARSGHRSSIFTKIKDSAISPKTPFIVQTERSQMECAVRCTSATRCHDFTFGNGVCSLYTASEQTKELCTSTDCDTYHRKRH